MSDADALDAALFDGEAYAEMAALLRRAERTACVAFYLFGGPDADVLIDILAERQNAGVRVRVLLDRALGRNNFLPGIVWECGQAYRRLRARGIPVRLSDPTPLPGWPGRVPQMHRKFLAVDGREALVGGMNVGTLFRGYHDLMLHLHGPVAGSLRALFDAEWGGGEDADAVPAMPAPGPVRLLGTGAGQVSTEDALIRRLDAAQASVSVALCEMGRTPPLDALIACHRRGVSVRVLLDPLVSYPWLPAAPLNAGAVAALHAARVPVRFYRLGPDFQRLHLKLALFDGAAAIAGSTNWTRGGFGWVRETDVEVCGGPIVPQLTAQFESDWQRADPAPPPSFLARQQYALYERLMQ